MNPDSPQTPPSSGVPPRTTGGNWRWTPPSPAELQALLTNYEIESLLGHGGMGAVYKGIQKGLDRPVAIKILPPGIEKEDPTFADRFKNEAKLMARLMHPAIVTVFEFGQTSAGQLYFVMEFVDGTDIHHMLRAAPGGRLPPEHALAITAHVCDALTYAHTHGVVHRDIKPANILINSEGQVKVADFGLAKIDDPGERGFTQTGMAMGTPDYVAPEALVLGTAIDGRADLYAVGVMLYQMLTGEVPRGMFKPASVRVPGLDKRFDAIVEKAMQTDRDERYPTSAALRADLDQLIFQPVSAAQLQQFTTGMVRQAVPVKEEKPSRAGTRAGGHASLESVSPVTESKSKTPIHIAISVVTALGVAALAFFGPLGVGKKKPEDPPAVAAKPTKGTLTSSATPAPPAPVKATPASPPPAKGTLTSSSTKSSPPPPKPVQASPAVASKPAEPQFPPGKWVRLDETAQMAALSEGEGGWIAPIGNFKELEFARGRNQGIRFRSQVSTSTSGDAHMLAVRSRKEDGKDVTRYQFLLSAGSGALSVRRNEGTSATAPILKSLSKIPLQANTELQMEFAAVGERLIARVNGRLESVVADSVYGEGYLAFRNVFPIRDIEVINLDGLPETEALKILGVDEQGNDLRGAAGIAISSPAFPITDPQSSLSNAAPTAFPPGQWVKVFTQIEDLPKSMHSGSGQVRLEDGWIHSDLAVRRKLDLPGELLNNYGIRSRMIYFKGGEYTTRSEIGVRQGRVQLSGGVQSHCAYLDTASSRQLLQRNLDGNYDRLASRTTSQEFKDGEDVLQEVAVVGARQIFRVNDEPPLIHNDPTINKSGKGYIYFYKSIRDIEVINLDGLPEAEALRLLGVDENGNDLRALAAQQEQQKAEMAKQADALAAIPELKTLHEQFVKLQAERVTAPFNEDVAKLNAGYEGGIDREIENEKKAGHLDGVIVLEAEKKLIQGVTASSRQPSDGRQDAVPPCPIPAEDAATTTEALKKLRDIYRGAYAKLETTRAANLKLLTDPLDTRLRQIETALTQQDRIDHAKTVREYREGLGRAAGPPAAASGPAAPNPPSTALGGSSAPPAKFPKGDDRKAAEWVMSLGGAGSVTVLSPGIPAKVLRIGDSLPQQSFVVTKLDLAFGSGSPPPSIPLDDLRPLAGLQDLQTLRLSGSHFTEPMLEILPSLPKLSELRLVGGVSFSDNAVDMIKHCKSLTSLTLEDNKNFTGSRLDELTPLKLTAFSLKNTGVDGAKLKAISSWSDLTSITLWYHDFRDEDMQTFSHLNRLETLQLQRSGITFAGLTHFANSRQLTTLSLMPPPNPPTPEFLRVVELFPKLSVYRMEGPCARAQVAALAAFRNLETLEITREPTSDESVLGVLDLPKLKTLRLMYKGGENITSEAFKQLAAHKSLERIISDGLPLLTDDALMALADMRQLKQLELGPTPKLTTAGIAAFKKKRPEVTLTR